MKKITSIRLSQEALEIIEKIKEKTGLTTSAVIEMIIREKGQ